MKRFILLLIIKASLLSIPGLRAQDGQLYLEDLSTPSVTKVRPAQGIIWKVEGPKIPEASYIYAVLHVVPKAHFFLPPALDSIMDEVDRVLMEVEPMEESPDYLFRSGLPFDSTLDVLLPRREYRWLEEVIEKEMSPLSEKKLMERYPPLFLLRQMMLDYCLYLGEGREEIYYEKYLRQATQERKFTSLEMDWIRLAWLDSHSFREQTDMMMEELMYRKERKAAFEGMMRAYRQQNLDRVWLLSFDSPDLGDNKHALYDLRVDRWRRGIEDYFSISPTCAVVPVILLPGEYGLLHQLRKAGYQVEPLLY